MITEKLKEAKEIPTEIVEVVKKSVIDVFASIAGVPPEYNESTDGEAPLNGMIGK